MPRQENDFYPTPIELAQAAVNALPAGLMPYHNLKVLDPGCGSGAWGKAVRRRFSNNDGMRLTGIDLDWRKFTVQSADIYDEKIVGDFLADQNGLTPESFDLVVGNPPYAKLCEAFVRESWRLLKPGGRMAFLVRLAFLGTQGRGRGLWREMPPYRVSVCVTRPSFTTDGHTERGMEYGVVYWQKKDPNDFSTWNPDCTLGWLDWLPAGLPQTLWDGVKR